MKILLIPIGSHGDVHPFVGLGMELARRGHRVVVITNPHFQKLIERARLEFVGLGTEAQFQEALANSAVWHPVEGFKLLLGYLVEMLRPLYQLVTEHYVPGETVMVYQPTGLGARLAQEKFSIPAATVHLAPSSLRSVVDPLVLPNVWLPTWTPRFLKRLIFWWGDQYVVAPVLDKPLNDFRAELSLPPISRPMAGWWNSPQRILALFPDWFAPMAQDWPEQTRLCGFPLFDERGMAELPAGLEEFLQAGEPPVLFTPGSAMRHGQQFFQAAVEACQRLNRRGLLLTVYPDHLPKDLPASIRYFSYIPFSEVFPRVAAVVHHGGIGTTSQGLASGTPQLIMPMGFDQPDNAARLERLGIGAVLSPGKFTGANLSAKLQTLLQPEVRQRAQELARRLTEQRSVKRACGWIEELLEVTKRPVLT